jgi:hypothetical protein
VEARVTALVHYDEFPNGYKTIVIYFSGHGITIIADDGEQFSYEKVITGRLKNEILIDAARGS